MSIDELTTSGESPVQDSDAGKRWPGGRKLGASILRRIAEAVRGFPDQDHLWFIGPLKYDPDDGGHRLVGPFEHSGEADDYFEAKQLNPATHRVLGPFDGKKDPEQPTPKKQWCVTSVVVHLAGPGNATREIVLDPELHDAVLWRQSAVEKFLVPYYTAIGSLDEGKVVNEAMDKAETLALIHRPGSEWVEGIGAGPREELPGSEDGIGLYGIRLSEDGIIEPRAVPIL